MNNLSPIVLFTYRRIPKKTIESLQTNPLASRSELIIFSDNYKNDRDKQDVQGVREYIKTINGFKKIIIIKREKNFGLANNIINGVTEIINKFGKVIVLEDDLIVSENFLDYMNEALNFYQDDRRIWSISGYSPKLKCLEDYDKDVYLSFRANSWGWATWKDRWQIIDWDIKDWKQFRQNKQAIRQFNRGGNDLFKMLELQMMGKIDSWAIRWCYNQFKQGRYTVYPEKSKILNIGFDNKGTHNSTNHRKWETSISNKKVVFIPLEIDSNLAKCFKRFYNLSPKTQIGYFLRKYGGYKIAKKIIK